MSSQAMFGGYARLLEYSILLVIVEWREYFFSTVGNILHQYQIFEKNIFYLILVFINTNLFIKIEVNFIKLIFTQFVFNK